MVVQVVRVVYMIRHKCKREFRLRSYGDMVTVMDEGPTRTPNINGGI